LIASRLPWVDSDDAPLAEAAAAETEVVAEVPLTDATTAKGFVVALYDAVELSCAEDHVEAVMVDEGAEVVEDDEGATQVDDEVGATQVDVDEGAAQVEVEVGGVHVEVGATQGDVLGSVHCEVEVVVAD
jgi:hypothetical protein